MHNDSIGKRVKHFREHVGLNQEQLSVEIGWDQSAISRIERDKQEIPTRFLNAMMLRFAVNSDWIMTGEGEMYIAPEKFIANGIRFLGEQKYGEGLARIFDDQQFAELQSIVTVGEMTKGSSDPKLGAYLQYILDKWHQGDKTVRGWLMIQLGIAFQEVAKKLQEEKKE